MIVIYGAHAELPNLDIRFKRVLSSSSTLLDYVWTGSRNNPHTLQILNPRAVERVHVVLRTSNRSIHGRFSLNRAFQVSKSPILSPVRVWGP